MRIKNILLIILSVGVLFYVLSIVSANCAMASIGGSYVSVNVGVKDCQGPLSGVNVKVKCVHNGIVNRDTPEKSNLDGLSSFQFLQNVNNGADLGCKNLCGEGDEVTVEATKNGVKESVSGIVENDEVFLELSFDPETPVVPEFGFIIGGLTILSAVGVFFIIRRK